MSSVRSTRRPLPAVSGIQTAGFTNKVKLASSNGSLDSLQRIKAGQVQYVDVGTSPLYNGWQFADGIITMMTGSVPVAQPGIFRVFTKANVGGLTLTPGRVRNERLVRVRRIQADLHRSLGCLGHVTGSGSAGDPCTEQDLRSGTGSH